MTAHVLCEKRAVFGIEQPLLGKKKLISLAAESVHSEPWMPLLIGSRPYLARRLCGDSRFATAGSSLPIMSCQAATPFSRINSNATIGPDVIKFSRFLKWEISTVTATHSISQWDISTAIDGILF